MRKLRRISMLFFAFGLGLLCRLFWNAGNSIEPFLFSKGHGDEWWAILLLFWLVDTALVLGFVAVYRWPVDFRQSEIVSFPLVASDLAIAVLFFHLALLANDHVLHVRLEAVGLGSLTEFFLIVMFVWVLVVIRRYERLSRLDNAKVERSSRIKWPSGRRTSIFSGSGRYGHRPK